MTAVRIIILGGGFAGVKCAKTLRKLLPRGQYEIVLFNQENHMVFHPLLAEVSAAVVEPRDVAAPLRQLLKGVQCRTEKVLSVDLNRNEIAYEADDGQHRPMPYDQLVIAGGSTVNLGVVPGMADHAFAMKTVGDAIALQGHVMEQLEKADVCGDTERKRSYLSFIVVGGGFSGVEVAGELNELVRRSCKFYQNISTEDLTITLIHSGNQILPEVCPSLREFAQAKMEEAGVRILLNSSASVCTHEGVGLKDGAFVRGGTVVCTIGTRPLPLVERIAVEKNRGRLITEPDMSLPGHANVWAVGDCAAIVNAVDGKVSPPTGQFAERQGIQAARNIVARLEGKPTRPFSYKSLGSLCSIGGHNAVAEMMGLRISGFAAWFCWRGVYLFKLPSITQKIKVGVEWFFDLIFPRPLAHLKADRTNRVSRAHYPAGDFIFREGDPASDFYIIEEGQVEILHPTNSNGAYEPIAILGPGDFFGEGALIDSRPRRNACRARTDVEALVLGRNLFTEISSSLAPLRNALASSVKRRTSIWQQLPEVRSILDTIPLGEHIEPVLVEPLRIDSPLGEAIGKINQKKLDVLFVTDDQNKLVGIVTRTDLLRAMEVAATLPQDKHIGMKVKDIMVPDPIALTLNDSSTVAVTTMREHGLKKIPIVESDSNRLLKGYIRIENVMETVVKRMLEARAVAAKAVAN